MRKSIVRLAVGFILIGLIIYGCLCVQQTLSPGGFSAHAAPVRDRQDISRPSRHSTHAKCVASPADLDRQIEKLGERFSGHVGIAITQVGCPWLAGYNEESYFPQQSVSKLWVSLAILDGVDRGSLALDNRVQILPSDLTVLNQPIRQEILAHGSVNRSLKQLMRDALSLSDNTANDQLLRRAGGSLAIRRTLQIKGLSGIRFGPGERLLQSSIAGLRWHPDFSLGRNFYDARAALPAKVRKRALDAYLANPVDGATPAAIAKALAKLAGGQLLSKGSTRYFMDELAKTHSGPLRLKAGVPAGWKVYHKTGTGQELAGRATGYNDVAILASPTGRVYSVAVMIGETRQAIPVRMRMMQNVSREISRIDRR